MLVAAAFLAAAWLAYVAFAPVHLPSTPFEFNVAPGGGLKSISRQLSADGVLPDPGSFWILARITGKARSIQAGTYRLERPVTGLELLDKLARGDVFYLDMLFVEGTTLSQWMAQLAAQPRVKHTLAGQAEPDIRAALGEAEPLEGWLFPDTYKFAPGTPDVEILKRAHMAMKKRMGEAWPARDPEVTVKTPYEALILASIVEKETGQAAERPLIASVFENRMKRGMRLQTDPTVIYGLGDKYDGSIHKRDLLTDTPWNTYTRDGLPPTAIAMPGIAAIRAVLHPAASDYIYFVARGDGTHEFSRNLEDHNRAVAKYVLGGKQ